MRVLHILDHSLPLHSGYVFRTVNILRAQRDRGWETAHLTSAKHPANGAAVETIEGLTFHRTPPCKSVRGRLPILNHLAVIDTTTRRLDDVIRAERPDILHAHSPVLNAMAGLRLARRHGLPLVYEVRAFWEDAAADHGTARPWGPRYRLTRALETRALRRADAVTTICEGLRHDIVGRGIPADKVTVIPNGVDVGAFSTARARDAGLARSLGLDGALVLGYVGSFYAYEGLGLLLDALAALARSPGSARIMALLVGGGPMEESLKAQAAALGIEDRVRFVGRVPHAEVQRYYDLIDLLVYARHSLRLTELVTPLKPLEAMAQGRMLVASDVGGHRELISDGETGFLFRADKVDALVSTIRRVLDARAQWPEIGANGRAFAETERAWPVCIAPYAEVYAKARAAIDTAGG